MTQDEDSYKSSISVPTFPLESFKERAQALRVDPLQLARLIVTWSLERGSLPEDLSLPEHLAAGSRSTLAFQVDGEFVEQIGGRRRFRDALRWAIVEGLDLSPLAPPSTASPEE